ncbi:transporter substrate-binding domain-containing protein [Burkholderia cepacia]|uniref:transporter substrate-binding domain-containing protein n=1 Tax=Burkholderia cepacia TaxID=292 RepID=UPI00158CD206|nr:transporter substrate-binding domain-containing protein [Burkholderia cepacia]
MSKLNKLVLAVSLAVSTSAFAGEAIDTIKKSGEFVIATRPASIPNAGKPVDPKFGEYAGYSVDICNLIHDKFDAKFKVKTKVRYVQVDGKTRWLVIDGNNAQIECGSTTWLAERSDKFDKVIVDEDVIGAVALNNTTIKTIEDLKDKRIVVVSGTTGEKAINKLKNEKGWSNPVLSVGEYPSGLKAVETGMADVLITDKNLAAGIFAKSGATNAKLIDGIVLGKPEPIALIMSNRDKEFTSFVNLTVQEMIKDGSLFKLHEQWFNNPRPEFGGINLKVQLSAEQKKAIIEQK